MLAPSAALAGVSANRRRVRDPGLGLGAGAVIQGDVMAATVDEVSCHGEAMTPRPMNAICSLLSDTVLSPSGRDSPIIIRSQPDTSVFP